MTFDEFARKLAQMKAEHKSRTGRDLLLVSELELLVDKRLAKPKSKGAKSLKSIFG